MKEYRMQTNYFTCAEQKVKIYDISPGNLLKTSGLAK